MRKISIPLILLIAAVVIFTYQSANKKTDTIVPSLTGSVAGGQTEQKKVVSVVLNFGDDHIATYSATNTATAFDALNQVTKDNNILFSVKEYSFGKLVEKIGEKENTKDMAWIFYVNGKSADKGADQFEVFDGDIIEWKYIKPSY